MKKQLREILKLIWHFDRTWFTARLANTVLLALLLPVNTFVLQNMMDTILWMLRQDSPAIFSKSAIISGGSAVSRLSVFVVMAGVLLLEVVLTHFGNYAELKSDMQMTARLENAILQKYRTLDFRCYEDSATYDIISRISQNPSEKIQSISWKMLELIKTAVTLSGLLLLYQKASPLLAAAFFLFLVPMLYENYQAGSVWYELYERQTTDERRIAYYETLLTTKTSLLELKISGAVDYIRLLWSGRTASMLKEKDAALQKVRTCLLKKSLFAALWYGSSAGLLLYGVNAGRISVGSFVALFYTTLSIVENITGLLEIFGDFSKEIRETSYISRFFGLPVDTDRRERIQPPVTRISFENVHFTYPGSEKEILTGISFTLDSSRSTALVGENGSGKSTIIKLLCGLYRPTKGRILLDGRDLAELDSREIGKAVRVVFQDFFSYELTLRENIAFGNLRDLENEEKLKVVLALAGLENLEEMDLDQPLGRLEKGGIDLSKGQWQRLAVSRIFLDSDAFAVLDEPTASMDPGAECRLYELVCSRMKSGGSLLISHRLTASRMADRILVLKEGRLVEQGTHGELMEKQGEYCRLFCRQAQWYQ